MESIYLLSCNHYLIKHFIDYSMVGDLFNVVGINTSNCLSVKEIEMSNASILLVDELEKNREIGYILYELLKEKKNEKIRIVYMGKDIDLHTIKLLHSFSYHHIISNACNFFDLLYLIEKIKKNRNNDQWEVEGFVENQLYKLMISTNLLGFTYLKEAILLKLENPHIKMTTIYDKIARTHNTLSTRVDRCMRTAITSSFNENKNIFLSYCQFEKKPSSMNFITRCAYDVRRQF